MNYFKIFNLFIFIIFCFLISKNYFSDKFLISKKKSREEYKNYLSSKINEMKLINTNKNFKHFKDNSKYFKKDSEEKEFWKLLKTR